MLLLGFAETIIPFVICNVLFRKLKGVYVLFKFIFFISSKFGDAWDDMSEKEKQEHLAKMKANEELNTGDEETQR